MQFLDLTLPIFPVPVFLLPGGIARLRIFEPRYLKMVRISLQNDGFVICENNQSLPAIEAQWGSWVEIINFDEGLDSILEIDVKCKSLVEIQIIEHDKKQLNFAKVSPIEHWSEQQLVEPVQSLQNTLQKAFSSDELLTQLYAQSVTNEPAWVVARWLELLPVKFEVKNRFVFEYDFQAAKHFVHSIVAS